MMNNRNSDRRLWRIGSLLFIVALIAPSIIWSKPDDPTRVLTKRLPIKPSIPSADRRQSGKVFLERADRLYMDEKVSTEYQVVVGDVLFRKEGMFMYCDSAHFYENAGSFDAFGNVKMQQGDTLFVYADELIYDGDSEFATFYGDNGKKVKLINNEVTLETYVFYYDVAANLGFYDNHGTITDAENQLISTYGEYSPDTKEAEFRENVLLQDLKKEDFRMTTDLLRYNTETHMARIVSPTVIETDSGTVYSSNGWYDTESEKSELYDRSLVVTNGGSTLTGDTIYFDHLAGFGEVWGDMVLTDSVRQTALEGGYGIYYQDKDSAYATDRARILEYSKGDTLYLHGDTIRAYMLMEDTTRIMTAFPRVRFWRVDMQGLCDSLVFLERDSTLSMYRHPIVWSDQRQIFGNVIDVHFNDSTADWAKLPDFGFMAEHIDEEFYNQISGKEMLATFEDGNLRQLDVSGNVEVISLPEENDSTYNKIVNSESSFLKALFRDNKLERMMMWPEVTGKVTPLYLAKKNIFYLSAFQWYEPLRPKDKDDIFNIPPEMEALFKEPDTSTRRRLTH